MNFPAIGAVILLAGLVNLTSAKEPLPLPDSQVSVQLAAPPMDGTVSIGVFDSKGQCIRVLFKNTDQEKIPSALNGFSVVWDGKTDTGTVAPKGEYEIRGVTVGDVSSKGETYHFNDWIDADQPANSPIATSAVQWLEGGDFLVLQQAADRRQFLARYDAKGTRLWKLELPLQAPQLAVSNHTAYLADANQVLTVDLEKGTAIETQPATGFSALAADATQVFAIKANELLHVDNPASSGPEPALPPSSAWLAASGDSVLVSDRANVFRKTAAGFEKINLPPVGPINHLAIGKESAFWVSSGAILTEFDLNGQPLRSLEAEEGEKFLTFDVSANDDRVALVSSQPQRERFRILQLTASPAADVSLWKTALQKDLQSCDQFGIALASGKPVPKGDLPADPSVPLALVENPLTPGRKGSIAFTPASLDGDLWLTTKGGLPVIEIAADLSAKRLALIRGKKPGSLTFYANLGGAVAEFSINRLQNIMQFTSEKIQWPPGSRQTADETNVPGNEPAPTP